MRRARRARPRRRRDRAAPCALSPRSALGSPSRSPLEREQRRRIRRARTSGGRAPAHATRAVLRACSFVVAKADDARARASIRADERIEPAQATFPGDSADRECEQAAAHARSCAASEQAVFEASCRRSRRSTTTTPFARLEGRDRASLDAPLDGASARRDAELAEARAAHRTAAASDCVCAVRSPHAAAAAARRRRAAASIRRAARARARHQRAAARRARRHRRCVE